jgi:hypothetical protein
MSAWSSAREPATAPYPGCRLELADTGARLSGVRCKVSPGLSTLGDRERRHAQHQRCEEKEPTQLILQELCRIPRNEDFFVAGNDIHVDARFGRRDLSL